MLEVEEGEGKKVSYGICKKQEKFIKEKGDDEICEDFAPI